MKKRFILILDAATKKQNDAFLEVVKAKHMGWWHWIGNAWLFSNPAGDVTASQLRDLANVHFPSAHKIVLELSDDGTDTWSGFGPTRADRDMFKWIKQNWKKADPAKPAK